MNSKRKQKLLKKYNEAYPVIAWGINNNIIPDMGGKEGINHHAIRYAAKNQEERDWLIEQVS